MGKKDELLFEREQAGMCEKDKLRRERKAIKSGRQRPLNYREAIKNSKVRMTLGNSYICNELSNVFYLHGLGPGPVGTIM